MNLQTASVRTTIDLSPELFRRAKIYAADKGKSLKSVVAEAIERHVGIEVLPSAEVLWEKMRRLAKEGRQDVDLVEALRKDRDSHF